MKPRRPMRCPWKCQEDYQVVGSCGQRSQKGLQGRDCTDDLEAETEGFLKVLKEATQFYIDTLCQKSTNFTDLLRRTELKDHANQEAIPGCLYADEAVVGNVLAPDNRRRSWCFYFCWMSILPMRKDTLWLPISVIRTDIIEQLPGGLPQALSIVMRQCQQFLSDGIIVDGQIKKHCVLNETNGTKSTVC